MASVPLVSSDGLFLVRGKSDFRGGKSVSLVKFKGFLCFLRSFSYPSASPSLLRFHNRYESQHKPVCCTSIRSVINGTTNKEVPFGKSESSGLRKRFSVRLRPRFRLLSIRLRRAWIKSTLNNVGTFWRKNLKRVIISASITIVLGLCYLLLKFTAMPSPKIVPYSDLIASLKMGTVSRVLFEEGSRRIYYNTNLNGVENIEASESNSNELKVPDKDVLVKVTSNNLARDFHVNNVNSFIKMTKAGATPQWHYSTRKVDHDEGYLLNLLREQGTAYSSSPQSALASMRNTLMTVLCLWIPLTPLMWLLHRQLSTANSPARKRRPSNKLVSFDDVEGVDTAKVELMEIVSCLQGASNYHKLGAKLPRGILLVGPPGTGKTLLARAVAGEAQVPFFTVSASEFVELFVGRGAARIRDLFNVARKNAPSIIFIDELDAVGGKRGRSFNDERDQTLNQLLTEMDGFESDMNIVVIGATNRPEALDPALCRPGRFSRKVFVGEPNEDGRRKILAVHLRGVPIEEETNLICDLVASLTHGFVGADLANIVNEAALLAGRRGGDCVLREDFMEAIERTKFGINNRQTSSNTISKEIGKLFPWMPSLLWKNESRRDAMPGPLGYQTLS